MNPTWIKIAKIVVKVASIAVPIAAGYFENKDLDDKIMKAAAKAVADQSKGES